LNQPSDIASCSAELARLTAHVDSLQRQSDEDIRTLRDVMMCRLLSVHASLCQLKDAMAAQRPEARSRGVEAQLGELRATDDADCWCLPDTIAPNSGETRAQS
jgi:hypothetical protein